LTDKDAHATLGMWNRGVTLLVKYRSRQPFTRLGLTAITSVMLTVALFVSPFQAIAATDLQSQLNQSSSQIEQLRQQAAATEAAGDTLAGQIAAMQAQAAVIQASINDTNTKVAAANAALEATKQAMAGKQATLISEMRSNYYLAGTSTIEELIGSDSLTAFLDKKQYLDSASKKLSDILAEVQKLKRQQEQERDQLAVLQQKQTSQKAELAAQISAQNDLLAKTRGDEAAYKQQLSAAQAAQADLLSKISATIGGGRLNIKGHVEKGQVIGFEGSTGNSTGAHLHFSSYQNRSPVDPSHFIGGGMPIAYSFITQGFGCTSYTFEVYNASCPQKHFHDGIDLVGDYGTPVHAVAAGNIIDLGDGGWQGNGFGHYVVIDHGNGLWTLYGHMQ
jgi:septal ring factor EnvC (AmiA/AmiB activator)